MQFEVENEKIVKTLQKLNFVKNSLMVIIELKTFVRFEFEKKKIVKTLQDQKLFKFDEFADFKRCFQQIE